MHGSTSTYARMIRGRIEMCLKPKYRRKSQTQLRLRGNPYERRGGKKSYMPTYVYIYWETKRKGKIWLGSLDKQRSRASMMTLCAWRKRKERRELDYVTELLAVRRCLFWTCGSLWRHFKDEERERERKKASREQLAAATTAAGRSWWSIGEWIRLLPTRRVN